MKTQHTPGPWIVTEYDGRGPMEVQSSENPGASLALVYAEHPDQMEPNARLIAAAPELLETLQNLVREVIVHFEKKNMDTTGQIPAIHNAKIAIFKATGEDTKAGS